jgi:hypothetical protein
LRKFIDKEQSVSVMLTWLKKGAINKLATTNQNIIVHSRIKKDTYGRGVEERGITYVGGNVYGN